MEVIVEIRSVRAASVNEHNQGLGISVLILSLLEDAVSFQARLFDSNDGGSRFRHG
jgi:hypothetical protein